MCSVSIDRLMLFAMPPYFISIVYIYIMIARRCGKSVKGDELLCPAHYSAAFSRQSFVRYIYIYKGVFFMVVFKKLCVRVILDVCLVLLLGMFLTFDFKSR